MNSPTDKPTRYLSASDLYNINFTITGGDTFVRDMHLLASAAKRPSLSIFGQPQFPTIADKAAALLHSLAYHHLFVDGNKRTAMKAVEWFLDINDYDLALSEAELDAFVLEIAKGKLQVEGIAEALRPYIILQDQHDD